MKYFVKEFNILTNTILAIHEFDTEEEAFAYAWYMNGAMKDTHLRYRLLN